MGSLSEFWNFVFASQNLPFAVSAITSLSLVLIQLLSLLVAGIDLGESIDNLLPDFGVDADADVDIDVDASPEADVAVSPSSFAVALDWLHLGKIPFFILLILVLCSFGVSGLMIQYIFREFFEFLMPGIIASGLAFATTLPIVHFLGKPLAKLFKEETSAVSQDSFIGSIATITLGIAQVGRPAEAKLVDRYGRPHYVMVEPDPERHGDISFSDGDSVVLVDRKESVFLAVPFDDR
jgi:hypothetical protein